MAEHNIYFDSTYRLRVVEEDKFKDTERLSEECSNFNTSELLFHATDHSCCAHMLLKCRVQTRTETAKSLSECVCACRDGAVSRNSPAAGGGHAQACFQDRGRQAQGARTAE
eukprot:3933034-Rhodomonas_salina.2